MLPRKATTSETAPHSTRAHPILKKILQGTYEHPTLQMRKTEAYRSRQPSEEFAV